MRIWIGVGVLAVTLFMAPTALAKFVKSSGSQVSAEGKYGKVKFQDPHRSVSKNVGILEFKGRIYFRPRNGGCFVSVLGRNGDLVNGTGDLVHPGCEAGKWEWWDIKWTDNGKDGHFDTTVDFLKAQYKSTLIHGSGDEWELCLD